MFVDSAGRRVPVPAPPRRVLPSGNPAAAAVYCVARDRLIGWPEPPPGQAAPIGAGLPNAPRLNPHGLADSVAAVRAAAPDLVLDFGTLTGAFTAFADRLQGATGVPVAIIDGRLARTRQSLEQLGRLLGDAERAEELACVWDRIWRDARAAVRGGGETRRVHYAIGPGGAQTARSGSIHVESLRLLGAENAARVEAGAGGRVRVRASDVERWDPDLIVTIDAAFHARAARLDGWRDVRAVGEGRVYLAPAPMLSWFDFPPSLNRVIGLAWLARLFHGARYRGDLAREATAFHRTFYGADLDAAALAAMLAKAGVG